MVGSKHQSEGTRRQQILLASDLILLESGLEGFTVDQIADKAGIAKGTIYKYYKNKDQILAALSIKAVSLLQDKFKQRAALHRSSLDKIKAICLENFHFNREYPHYYNLISFIERPEFELETEDYQKISSSIFDFVVEILKDGQARGEIKAELKPEVVDYILWACCLGVVQFIETKQQLIKKIHAIDSEEFMQTFSEMMVAGIKK